MHWFWKLGGPVSRQKKLGDSDSKMTPNILNTHTAEDGRAQRQNSPFIDDINCSYSDKCLMAWSLQGLLTHEVFIHASKTKGVGRKFLGKPAGYVEDSVSYLLLRGHKGHCLTPVFSANPPSKQQQKTTLDFIPRLAFLVVCEPGKLSVVSLV